MENLEERNTVLEEIKQDIKSGYFPVDEAIVTNNNGKNCHALTSMKINVQERRSMNAGSKDGADVEDADFKNKSWLTSILKWDFESCLYTEPRHSDDNTKIAGQACNANSAKP